MKTSASSASIPTLINEDALNILRPRMGLLSRLWSWIQSRQAARSSTGRLRVAETVSLGEKRFVAVVQVDGRHFLLAGGPTNIALLAQLDGKEAFQDVLHKTMTVAGRQPARRNRKHDASARGPANAPLTAHLKVTETLADVCKKKAVPPGKQPVKPARKQKSTARVPANVTPKAQLKMSAPRKQPAKRAARLGKYA